MPDFNAFTSTFIDRRSATQQRLRDEQQALFAILIEREQEFGFNPDIVVEYPEPLDALLADPAAYLDARIRAAESARGRPFARAAILTTYSDILGGPLVVAGYREEAIDMPAGPDNTRWYARGLQEEGAGVFYLEAVNEMDEKIQPSFVFKLNGAQGELIAGMSGSVWEQNGERCAYIATVVARDDAPAGAGSQVAAAVWAYLREQGVARVNLGTQTADRFYERQGFRVIHTIVPRLRYRTGADGNRVWHDLVIMRKDL
ncbi:GNAT family N-acetyltransferase [Chromobacterium phragmitis]|uniref:N-acetyltransferase n=1 Tax=Chromobacterium phragmitis TaxID=2202141 RepID=A0A344UGP2_9NEIS|nr:GNAT family N-acetyltransferase [Chromobacterium phragmitis]AXE34440.1 N-acetyltransferase [Chromobacterium phragmitis]